MGWPSITEVFSPGTPSDQIAQSINNSADGSVFLFLNGVHQLHETLQLTGVNKIVMGQSKSATLENDAGIMWEISGAGHRFSDLRFTTLGEINPGSLFRVNHAEGIAQTTFGDCEFFQNRMGSPIFNNVFGEVSDVRFRGCFGRHHLGATVPSWHFMDSVGGTGLQRKVTNVMFVGYRHLFSGQYAIACEAVDGSQTGPSNLTLLNTTWENCSGGCVRAGSVRNLVVESSWVGDFNDIDQIKRTSFLLEAAGSLPSSTGRLAGFQIGDVDSRYAAGVVDIRVPSLDSVRIQNLFTSNKIRLEIGG